jgi:hypothetical protein
VSSTSRTSSLDEPCPGSTGPRLARLKNEMRDGRRPTEAHVRRLVEEIWNQRNHEAAAEWYSEKYSASIG